MARRSAQPMLEEIFEPDPTCAGCGQPIDPDDLARVNGQPYCFRRCYGKALSDLWQERKGRKAVAS